jgi:hypothetical protein
MIRLFAYRRSLLCFTNQDLSTVHFLLEFFFFMHLVTNHSLYIHHERPKIPGVSSGHLERISRASWRCFVQPSPANLQMRLFRRANGHTIKSAVTHKIHGSSCLDTVCGRDVSTISLCEPEYYVLPTTPSHSKSRVLHSPSSRPWIRLSTRPNDEAE